MTGDHLNRILLALKAIAALVAAFWGGLPALVQALILLMLVDIVTGMLAAFSTQTLSSTVSFRGMARKAIVLLVVGAAGGLEPFAGGLPLGEAVAGFYLAHEGLSIIENAVEAGLPVPQALRDALDRLNPEDTPEAKKA